MFEKMKKKGSIAINSIILTVIGIVIAIALVPVIVSSVNSVTPNLSGGALILVGLVTLIFIAGIISLIVKKMIGGQ